jgi:hypothetical protein
MTNNVLNTPAQNRTMMNQMFWDQAVPLNPTLIQRIRKAIKRALKII